MYSEESPNLSCSELRAHPISCLPLISTRIPTEPSELHVLLASITSFPSPGCLCWMPVLPFDSQVIMDKLSHFSTVLCSTSWAIEGSAHFSLLYIFDPTMWHVGSSSLTRDLIHAPWMESTSLNHWTTDRELLTLLFLSYLIYKMEMITVPNK